MIRDFTDATKDRLLKQIDQINKEKWNWLTDALGDVAMNAGKWLGILSIDSDMKNIKSYQKNVLDMSNMTKKELRNIFDQVNKDDLHYKKLFSQLNERQSAYNNKLAALYAMINPNFEIASVATIKNEMKQYNQKLKELDGQITKQFEKELDFAAKESTRKSAIGFLKSLGKTVADVFLMPVTMAKSLYTGNVFGLITPVIDLIDDVFAMGGNIMGLTSIYSMSDDSFIVRVFLRTSILGFIIGQSTYNKQYWLNGTAPYAGSSGLTDTLEADLEANGDNPVTKFMLKVSKGMDTVNGVCSIADLGINIFKKPGKIFDTKFGFKTKIKGFEKADIVFKTKIVKKITSGNNWIKYQGIYYRLQKYYKYVDIKNAKKALDYIISIVDEDDSFFKQIFKNSDYYKIVEKLIKQYNNLKK